MKLPEPNHLHIDDSELLIAPIKSAALNSHVSLTMVSKNLKIFWWGQEGIIAQMPVYQSPQLK